MNFIKNYRRNDKGKVYLTIGQVFLCKNLPEDNLSQIRMLTNRQTFVKILIRFHPNLVWKPFNPLIMINVHLIQYIYYYSHPEMGTMLYHNLFTEVPVFKGTSFVGLTSAEPVGNYSTICYFRNSLEGTELEGSVVHRILSKK